MNKLKSMIVVLAILGLTACSSAPVKQYYQLPTVEVNVAATKAAQDQRMLWIQRIQLADMLGGTGLVYQTSDVNYTVASNNLWASPLEQQLLEVMTAELTQALPNRLVSMQPLTMKPDTLSFNVTSFHGRYDGQVIIAGDWTYVSGENIIKKPFNLVLQQKEDGYPDLVRTLSQGWGDIAKQIVESIQ